MKDINNKVFLNKIIEKINFGNYDKYFDHPLLNRTVLIKIIKTKIEKKISSKSTPILSEVEIMKCIDEARDIALESTEIYVKLGILVKNEKDYELTPNGEIFIKLMKRK